MTFLVAAAIAPAASAATRSLACPQAPPPAASVAAIVSRDVRVPSGDEGVELFVRHKRRADVARAGPEHTVLLLHGGTQSSEAVFDLSLDGFSWADYIAARGWDVWLMDLRGFGGSTKPAGMSQPAASVAPIGPLDAQVRDFEAVAAHIRRERGIPSLNVLAWSWGNVVAAHAAAAHPERIGRFAMFAPPWLYDEFPAHVQRGFKSDVVLPGWTSWTTEETWTRFKTGLPPGLPDDLTPPAWRKAWEQATLATDDQALTHSPPRVRTPSGVGHSMRERYRAGQPLYPAEKLKSPVLIAVGEWDGVTTPKSAAVLFGELKTAPEKRLVVLGGTTHVAPLERRRLELFSVVQEFLEARPGDTTLCR